MYFWFFFFLVVLVYCFLILLATMGWLGIKPLKESNIQFDPIFISVIIPFRNESKNLPALVQSLKRIEYPENLVEFIFVNDHSTDSSITILESEVTGMSNIQLLSNSKEEKGKKAALRKGILEATGELIIFTDADCVFSSGRLSDFAQFYTQSNFPDMIIGLVDYLPQSGLISAITRLEFLSLILVGAGLAGRGTPVYCNGANLAIKKTAFNDDIDLKEGIVSGDDVFMLHAFKKKQKRIKLLKTRNSIVHTSPPLNLKEFFSQRKRWGAKSVNYTDRESIILSFAVFFTSLALFVGLLLSVWNLSYCFFLAGLMAKLGFDTLIFLSGANFFKIGYSLFLIPVLELIYPFYILITSISGIIKKPFQWKGRVNIH